MHPYCTGNGLLMVVPTFASDKAEATIKYMDWMVSDPKIIKVLQNGELGKQHNGYYFYHKFSTFLIGILIVYNLVIRFVK